MHIGKEYFDVVVKVFRDLHDLELRGTVELLDLDFVYCQFLVHLHNLINLYMATTTYEKDVSLHELDWKYTLGENCYFLDQVRLFSKVFGVALVNVKLVISPYQYFRF